ncbi:hypothetical protein [Faucicola atlantae]|nr:hypothetical protein [Moraxella atlantae]
MNQLEKPSSYLPMEDLEVQQSVIDLGKHILQSLESHNSIDADLTTAWMINYLAEQINLAETSKNAEDDRKCFDTILLLWERYYSYPERIRPFKNFEPIIRALEAISPDNDRPKYYVKKIIDELSSQMKNEETHVSDWVENIEIIDNAAKNLIDYCLDQALLDAKDKETQELVEILKKTGLTNPIIDIFINYFDEEDESDSQSDEINQLQGKIKYLDDLQSIMGKIRQSINGEIDKLNNKS